MSAPQNQRDDNNGVFDIVNLSPPPAAPTSAHIPAGFPLPQNMQSPGIDHTFSSGAIAHTHGSSDLLSGADHFGALNPPAGGNHHHLNQPLNLNFMANPNIKLDDTAAERASKSMAFNNYNSLDSMSPQYPYAAPSTNSNANNALTLPLIAVHLSMQQDSLLPGGNTSYQNQNSIYLDGDDYLSDAEAAAFEADFLGIPPNSDLNPSVLLSKSPSSGNTANSLPKIEAENQSYLSPSNHLSIGRSHKRLISLAHSDYDQATRVDYLNPKSPAGSSFSSRSLYSEYLNNNEPTSPYADALSHYSNNFSDLGNDNSNNSGNIDSDNKQNEVYLVSNNQFNAPDSFETGILLGESISSTNLMGLNDTPQMTSAGDTPQEGLKSDVGQPESALTVSNLNTFEQLQFTNTDTSPIFNADGIRIAINQAPEEVAAKTPSLFSNSSANSSIHDSKSEKNGNRSRSNSNQNLNLNHLLPNSNYLGSNRSSVEDMDSDLLNIDDHQMLKRGRKKSYSDRSSSKSPLRNRSKSPFSDGGEDLGLNPISSREKMLELASPNQSSKRTQKHPSLFACDLCGKLFTRPYNLKSHYRTHTDERPFICSVCGKAFARQHDRKRHEDLHLGEKKFQCKGFLRNGAEYGCGRKFARADALRRHFQTEAGKNCIRLLIEEDAQEKKNGRPGSEMLASLTTPSTSSDGYLSPTNIPQVAISPPE